ncbi:MAG: MopE-related protein, partial [Myxococcota bacterium]
CSDADDCPEPAAYACVPFANSGSDLQNLCVPTGVCIDNDDDGFGFGPGCEDRDCDDDDPDTFPGADEVCDGVDNDCDGAEDDNPIDINSVCETGTPGACSTGTSFCVEGVLVCEQSQQSSPEICDNIDNDCDGLTDEDDDSEPLSEACYAGPVGTMDVGACRAGARICMDGRSTDCIGQVLPSAEVCDGLDNDCDGLTDEDNLDAGVLCDTGQDGVCARGIQRCTEQGQVVCEPLTPAEDEVCDGRDNDCDGEVDEDDGGEPLTQPCYDGPDGTLGIGQCASGLRTCDEGQFGACDDQTLPRSEVCDFLDNDCDGQRDEADEGSLAGGFPCIVPDVQGACAQGRTECTEAGSTCMPIFTASQEVCDGVDNDCDGVTDENEEGEPLTQPCYDGPEATLGMGVCVGGLQTCEEGQFSTCRDQVLPGPETCDTLDNNCNGEADENNPGGGARCDVPGQQGVCQLGAQTCSEGVLSCNQLVESSAEVCDGLDNDCDGATDERADGQPLRETCYDGPEGTAGVGICRSGSRTCVDGEVGTCEGQQLPGLVELCNGDDDDCDGEVDEDNIDTGALCTTDLDGACQVAIQGTQVCTAEGTIVCEPLTPPSAEVCDGLDNDCDGLVDEGPDGQPLEESCYDGPEGTLGVGACTSGTRVCEDGRLSACRNQVRPRLELCDGLDNDCDRATDEGNPEGGINCDTGLEGVCSLGVQECLPGGQLNCVQQINASDSEVCDGLDNDCDGAVDEDDDGQPLAVPCYEGPEGTEGVGACRGGNRVCTNGEFSACSGQQLPSAEVCDGIDNNCNNSADEGNPGGGIACDTGDDGICAAGMTQCMGDRVACMPVSTSQPELCDGLDNDCNGVVDNGFGALGETCEVSQGICRRVGVLVCDSDPTAPAVCSATPGPANPAGETCDFNDDDCDGDVDEGFVNGDGVYDQVTDCGSCGLNCNNQWPGGPALFNVAPVCRVLGNSAACDFNCTGGYVDVDGIPDNGCEFLPDPDAIYVATPANGGNDAGSCGAYNSPCATIGRGLTRANAASRGKVNVSDGLYRENVALLNGIDLLGGFNAQSWNRDPTVNVTIIRGTTTSPTSPDRIAVTASGITQSTELSGFTINAENAAAGGNSIGVYLLNSDGDLAVRDNIIFAGQGGNGSLGTPGPNGLNGVTGSTGGTSQLRSNCSATLSGGTGGSRTCSNGTTTAGGRGGNSECPVHLTRNGAGANGVNAPGPLGDGGAGGLGAGHFVSLLDGQDQSQIGCYISPGLPIDALPGNPGEAGEDGTGGSGAADSDGQFSTATGQWRGASGGGGSSGDNGGGGGGGGAAAGIDGTPTNDDYTYGARGGGGGSGGCGAEEGQGGGAGGGSFSV